MYKPVMPLNGFLTNLRFVISACFFGILCGCSEKGDNPKVDVALEENNIVLVGQEGNFRWGNASLGVINLRQNQSDLAAYKTINNQDLGDVFQSAVFWKDQWWLVVNNSGKIEVVEKASLRKVKTISGLTSPRYVLPVSGEKAFVSDLYASGLWVLNTEQTQPLRKIEMPGWTEEMLLLDGKVYVVCRNARKIIRLDPETEQIIDSMLIPGKATSLARGPAGKLWVGFDVGPTTKPGIALFSSQSTLPENIWFCDHASQVPDRFQSSVTGDTVFFVANGVCFFTPSMSVIGRYSVGAGNWYGLGYDQNRRQLWVSDVKDYQQKSRVQQMDVSGRLIKEWTGGILTSQFYFW